MKGTGNCQTVTVDRYTRFCLTVIAVLLTVVIIGLWATAPVPRAGDAAAAAPRDGVTIMTDAKAQRAAMVKGIEATNRKLDRLITILETGKLRVVVVDGDANKGAGKRVGRPAPKAPE